MERITISLEDQLATSFDAFIREHGYTNRSEAVRDLIRRELGDEALERDASAYCVGSLTYVYNHNERELAARLTRKQHAHHDLALTTVHTHLDHEYCLETVMLRGPTASVRAFADEVIAQPGVHHGKLHLVAVDMERAHHGHNDDPPREHLHVPPRI
jgi:CopG family nickel-responsive transcriptional regulator